MRRIALNFVTAILVVLCLAIAMVWVRSHYVKDVYQHFRLYQPSGSYRFVADMIRSDDGIMTITRWEQLGPQTSMPTAAFAPVQKRAGWSVNRPPSVFIDVEINAFGFGYENTPPTAGPPAPLGPPATTADRALAIPYWFILLLLGLFPLTRVLVWRFRSWRARQRRDSPHHGNEREANPQRIALGFPVKTRDDSANK